MREDEKNIEINGDIYGVGVAQKGSTINQDIHLQNNHLGSFGHALYYPNIHLTDEQWLKHAFLFWDKISRIVPRSFYPNDSDDILKIKEETNFLENYHPSERVVNTTFQKFSKLLESHLNEGKILRRMSNENIEFFNPKNNKHIREMLSSKTRGNRIEIHIDKMSSSLLRLLSRLGLDYYHIDESWVSIDSEIGSLYMTYMAEAISNEKSIPMITDNEIFYAQQNRIFDKNKDNFEERLGYLLIDTVVPKNINNVTIEQLINIKTKYDNQRIEFFNEINKLSTTLPLLDSKSAVDDALNYHNKLLNKQTQELKKVFEGNRIDAVLKPLSITLPSTIASFSLPNQYMPLGVTTGILFGAISSYNEFKKREIQKQKHPMSYLLNIESELSKERLFQRIQSVAKNLF